MVANLVPAHHDQHMDHPPGHTAIPHAHTHQHAHLQHHPQHVIVTHTQPYHVAALAAAQRLAFPTLVDDELISVPKYLKHINLFPEGQIVALVRENGREVAIGSTSTFRTNFDFINHTHTFMEAIADGW